MALSTSLRAGVIITADFILVFLALVSISVRSHLPLRHLTLIEM